MAGPAAPKMPAPAPPKVREVPAIGPDGTPIFVPETKVDKLETGGGRVLTPESARVVQHKIDVENEPFSMIDYMAAGAHGRVRGQAEAFGVPIDEKAVDFAEALGGPESRKATQAYIKKLEEVYPSTSAINRVLGTVGGAVAGAEITGGGSVEKGLAGVVSRAARGGVENVVQNYASDFNEQALGGPAVNGEKMVAAMPKHFMFGAGAVLGLEGLGAMGRGLASAGAEAAPSLERGAMSAVARDAGGGAELGERIVGLNKGRLPGSASEVAEILSAEQGVIREGARGKYASEVAESVGRAEAQRGETILDAMGRGGQGVEEAELRAMQVRKGLDREIREIDSFRKQVASEHSTASDLAERLGKERAEHAEQLEKALEKVNDLNMPEYDPEHLRSIVGRDAPSALDYFNPMDGTKLQRAARAIETAESVAAENEVRRLVTVGDQIDNAHKAAMGHVADLDGVMRTLDYQYKERLAYLSGAKPHPDLMAAEAAIPRAEREGQKIVKEATKEADRTVADARKSVPKPSEKTELDPHVRAAQDAAARPAAGIGGGALVGAGISLGHGNVLGAGLSLLSGFASNTARLQGNYVAARVMRGLSAELTAFDQAIKTGAMRAIGVGGRAAAVAALPKGEEKPKPKVTFEQVSERVIAASSNPIIIQNRVQMAMGPWAAHAPMLYASTLSAAERAQEFLLSVLPRPQIDPYSLTPHLEKGDVPDSQKYDFMQYVSAIDDPIAVFRDVHDGTVTDQQIEAVQAVYPLLFAEMQMEVQRQMIFLEKPMPYEREINVGRLLGVRTNEVLDPTFQNMLRLSYEEKAENNAPMLGSKPNSAEANVSKGMMSDAQRVERGE